MLRPFESAPKIHSGEDLGYLPLKGCPDCGGRGWFCENPMPDQMADRKRFSACPTCWAAKKHSDEYGELPADIKAAVEDRILLADIMDVEIDDHADQINEMFSVVDLYWKNKQASGQLPKRAARKSELEQLTNALDVILRPGQTAEHIFAGTLEYAELLRSAATVREVLKTIIAEKSAHGPEPDDRKWMIGRLVSTYREITGLRAKVSWNENEETYCGKFYEVCCVLIREDEFPRKSLGKTIRETIASEGKER